MKIIFSFQFKIPAEVETAYLVICREFFGGAMFKDFAFDEQVSSVADGKGFVHIMIGNEDSDLLIFQPGNNSLDIFDCDGVNTGEGFIQ